VTKQLFERLDPEDVAEIERRMSDSPDFKALGVDLADPGTRRSLVLCFGMWLGIPAVTSKTGLPSEQPPEEVHAMARGPLAAAGGLYEADLILAALNSAYVDLDEVRSCLDFGCSSGRVVRVLATAYPETRWLGCDPNEPAIKWASGHLPGIEFFVSEQQPPLPIEDGSLDLVYAISVWSHFAPALGLRWFDEMHRLIRPGGHLLCTTHGLESVAHYALSGLRSEEQCRQITWDLYRRGCWYAQEFGSRGDWGVINQDWGTAFLSPEWVLTHLCPAWRVLEFVPGRNQRNQDVYLFQRV
jgi:SAM-dependent methyltransferase